MLQRPVVTVEQGQLQGKVATDYRGDRYFSFQGIPYAKAPLGDLRFKAPRPPEPWTRTRDATMEGNGCYARHMLYQNIVGAEDCLFLNVYTSHLPSQGTALKPVMVWIHGGGFGSGSGTTELYGPDFLLPEDVVVVTINYRVGLLGFLSLEDPSLGVPGNAGLKDQVMALKWVQRNISKFCGDPSNVTIFGESAGAVSVHYLMLSPMAKGLFHRAIAQSGCALSLWGRGQKSVHAVAKALKLDTVDERKVLKILQTLPVEEILRMQEKIPNMFVIHVVRSIGPVVETSSSEPAFLTEEPIDIINSGKFHKVPLMIGFTSREGMFWEIIHKAKHGEIRVMQDFETAIPYVLQIPKGSDLSKNIAQRIKSFYYGQEEPSVDNIDQYFQLQTDNFTLREMYRTINAQLAVASVPIFFYRASIQSTLNLYKRVGNLRNSGVCYGDDLGYIFKNTLTPEILPGSIEDNSVRRFVKLWATFARNGDPNPPQKDYLINVTWKATEDGQLHFLDIGENLTVGINPEAERMEFWEEIFSLLPNTYKL